MDNYKTVELTGASNVVNIIEKPAGGPNQAATSSKSAVPADDMLAGKGK